MPFRIALSGINAAATDLKVIGNNVANVSTTGFKESRVEFADVYGSSNLGVAETTPGSGVRIAGIAQQFSQGNLEFTDNNLDLAISGQGFFVVSDQGSQIYTRAGNFSVDREGYIVNSQNQQLVAYLADANGTITGARGNLQLDRSDITPLATSSVIAGLNLESTATEPAVAFDVNDPLSYNSSTSLSVYDSLGGEHLTTFYFRRDNTIPNSNQWSIYTYVDGTQAAGPDTLEFDSSGIVDTTTFSDTVTVTNFPVPGGASDLNFDIDFGNATQYGDLFGVNSLVQDGYTTGRLNGLDIGETGVMTARFTNGQSRTLGQVALANFSNPQGLRQNGDTAWSETFESGSALISTAGSSGLGLVQSGSLEASNVDLTSQLVALITAQRNFQANAQVISTADTVTQTIINIR